MKRYFASLLLFALFFNVIAPMAVFGDPTSAQDVQVLTKEPDRPFVQVDVIEESSRGRAAESHSLRSTKGSAPS